MDIIICLEDSPPSSAGSPFLIYTVYSYIATWHPKCYNDSLMNPGCGHFCISPTELMLLLRKLEARTIHCDLLHKCCIPVLKVSIRTFLPDNAFASLF